MNPAAASPAALNIEVNMAPAAQAYCKFADDRHDALVGSCVILAILFLLSTVELCDMSGVAVEAAMLTIVGA